jgi:hypothetical protein
VVRFSRLERARTQRDEHGAAAVEFALVVPILFLIIFGIVQYGIYFYDAAGSRTGVREAARQGVVKSFLPCGTATTDYDKLKCNTEDMIEAVAGDTYVKVSAPEGWAKGKRLVVCSIVKTDGAIGFLPMPNDGVIMSKTQMSIEVDGAPSGTASADTPPTGTSWSWCP